MGNLFQDFLGFKRITTACKLLEMSFLKKINQKAKGEECLKETAQQTPRLVLGEGG